MRPSALLFWAVLAQGLLAALGQSCPSVTLLPRRHGYGLGVLTASAVVPPLADLSNRSGYYYLNLREQTGDLDLSIYARGLSSAVVAVTLHCNGTSLAPACQPGQTCPPCLTLSSGATSFPVERSLTIPKELVQQISSGSAYIQISTVNNPNGELRGFGLPTCATPEGNVTYGTATAVTYSNVASAGDCCTLCQQDWLCQTYSYNRVTLTCSLKNFARALPSANSNVTSGTAPKQVYLVVRQDFVAVLTAGSSQHRATVMFTSVNDTSATWRVHVVHTVPDQELSPGAALVMRASDSNSNVSSTVVLGLTGPDRSPFGELVLRADLLAALQSYKLLLLLQPNSSAVPLQGLLLPTTAAVIASLPRGTMSAALQPPNRRGFDGGNVTVAVNFTSPLVGNEIWVTLPFDFAFNSVVMSSVVNVMGAIAPSRVVVLDDQRQIQLRWNVSQVPLINSTFLSFTITGVALPNNCDPKEFRLQTASCFVDNFMNAGVLYYRKCSLNSTTDVDIRATPSTGAPAAQSCSADGCNSCKFLYASAQGGDQVYSCEHQGQTFYRVNVSGCAVCGGAAPVITF